LLTLFPSANISFASSVNLSEAGSQSGEFHVSEVVLPPEFWSIAWLSVIEATVSPDPDI
jgi:hypothetical protein